MEDIQTVLLREDDIVVDPHPPEQHDRVVSSQGVVTVRPLGSIEDDSACEHKPCCARRCWR